MPKHIHKIIALFKNHKYAVLTAAVFMGIYLSLYALLSQPLLSHNSWDSYTLQALRWWEGKADLGQDYSHLELAYYDNKVFVSFPPIPSVVMFFLVPFFGAQTPSNLISTVFAFASFGLLYVIAGRYGFKKIDRVILSALATFGSNLMWMSLSGGVWFVAQGVGFFFSTLSLFFITSNKTSRYPLAFFSLALAVGCRPFQAIYFPLLFWILYTKVPFSLQSQSTKKLYLSILAGTVGLAILLATYNVIRFHDPFEFGHNYIIEFQREPQFLGSYIRKNLPNLFRLPYKENGILTFPRFDGFAVYLSNPIFLSFFISILLHIKEARRKLFFLVGLFTIHTVLILSHRTLGGWQFGNRYFVDLIPFAFFAIIVSRRKIYVFEWMLTLGAIVLNIYGGLWLFLNWP